MPDTIAEVLSRKLARVTSERDEAVALARRVRTILNMYADGPATQREMLIAGAVTSFLARIDKGGAR